MHYSPFPPYAPKAEHSLQKQRNKIVEIITQHEFNAIQHLIIFTFAVEWWHF